VPYKNSKLTQVLQSSLGNRLFTCWYIIHLEALCDLYNLSQVDKQRH
jgi:hypothetical protein